MNERETPFDIKKAEYSANTFSHATGIGCFEFDYDAQDGFPCACGSVYCDLLKQLSQRELDCCGAHRFAGIQAERFGGKYIYFCPLGLVHFISPLINAGSLRGAIVGGPLIMIEHEDFFIEEIVSGGRIPKDQWGSLRAELKKIPFVSPDRVSSLSEMLFIVSAYLNKDLTLNQAQNILEQQSTISETIHRIKDAEKEVEFYPISKERELLSKIALGDKLGARELLNDILGHIFFSSGGDFEIIKARVLELLVLLSRGAMEGGADTALIFGMNYNYLNEINSFKNIEQLTNWLSQIMVRFAETVFDMKDIKHADVIIKAVEYIKRNFMKKLTLEEVAEHIYLSPSYFSKVFGDEMKCSFNNYLNQVRIDNAKMLLLNDNIPLVNISQLCGFEDQSYFTKVFKKLTGITPGKYKESRGRAKVSANVE